MVSRVKNVEAALHHLLVDACTAEPRRSIIAVIAVQVGQWWPPCSTKFSGIIESPRITQRPSPRRGPPACQDSRRSGFFREMPRSQQSRRRRGYCGSCASGGGWLRSRPAAAANHRRRCFSWANWRPQTGRGSKSVFVLVLFIFVSVLSMTYIHEVEGLADWVGGCRGGILGVEGDTPYLIRHWPAFVFCAEDVRGLQMAHVRRWPTPCSPMALNADFSDLRRGVLGPLSRRT